MVKKAFIALVFLVAYVVLLAGLGYIWDTSYRQSYVSYESVDLMLASTDAIWFSLFLIYRYRTRNQWISAEAKRWLSKPVQERVGQFASRRRKLLGGLLWIPSLLVLMVSLFAFETVGLATHLFQSGTVILGQYRIRTPLTWVIFTDQKSYLSAIAVPGIGRIGFRRYWLNQTPVSEMSLYPVPHPEEQLTKNVPLDGQTVLAKHSFQFGKQTLTCWNLIHNNKFVGSYPTDPAIADIACSTENDDFYAHFSGWRGDTFAFYETLQRIKIAE